MGVSEKERGREGRSTEPGGGRAGQFALTGKATPDGTYLLARVNPRERLLLDEVAITPSKNWLREQDRRQARALLARAGNGQKVSEAEISKVQKRLSSRARQKALLDQESEEAQLVGELGEVRRTRLVSEANAVLKRAARGSPRPGREIEALQRRLLSMDRQDQLLGRASQGFQLALELGALRRSQLLAEASEALRDAGRGQRIRDARLEKLQQALTGMERQEELLGQDNEERRLVDQLGAVRRSQLLAQAKEALAQAARGRRLDRKYVERLRENLASAGRQSQLLGQESEELGLAAALAGLSR